MARTAAVAKSVKIDLPKGIADMKGKFEDTSRDSPIWVLKYDVFFKDGRFVDKGTEGAEKSTSCHGYYDTEEDAWTARREFYKRGSEGYRVEKVNRKILRKS